MAEKLTQQRSARLLLEQSKAGMRPKDADVASALADEYPDLEERGRALYSLAMEIPDATINLISVAGTNIAVATAF